MHNKNVMLTTFLFKRKYKIYKKPSKMTPDSNFLFEKKFHAKYFNGSLKTSWFYVPKIL